MLPFPSSSGIGVLLGIALPRCCSTALSRSCSLHPSAPFCCSGIGVLVGIAQALFNSLSRMTVRALRCGPANAIELLSVVERTAGPGLPSAADPGCGSCMAGAATVAHVTCRIQLSPRTTAADLTMPLPLCSHSSTLGPRVLAASIPADLSMLLLRVPHSSLMPPMCRPPCACSLNSSEPMSSIIFGQGAISCVGAGTCRRGGLYRAACKQQLPDASKQAPLRMPAAMCPSAAAMCWPWPLSRDRSCSLPPTANHPPFPASLPCSARSHHVRGVAPPLCGAHPVPGVERAAGRRPAG